MHYHLKSLVLYTAIQDAKTLENIINGAQNMLPSLREEYAQIMAELEKEEADIAEIENSDKNFLSDLKVSIAEQECVRSHFYRCHTYSVLLLALKCRRCKPTFPRHKPNSIG
jgi:hypothetical protein